MEGSQNTSNKVSHGMATVGRPTCWRLDTGITIHLHEMLCYEILSRILDIRWVTSEARSFTHSNEQGPIKLYMIQFIFKFYHMGNEKCITGTQKDKNYEINTILWKIKQ